MRSSAHYLRHSLAAAICLALAPMAVAATPEVSAERESITVGSEAPAYTLRLSYPDGRTSERVLLSGETFAIDAASPGGLLADGVYQFDAQPITGMRQRSDDQLDPEADKSSEFNLPTESGTFRVHEGRIVVANAEPNKQGDQDFGVRMKDQFFADDIVATGSACIGFDCVNGENFGFDTIRVKENNLRIHFQDTSNSGSFPSNDWRLVANDTSNGGANYFAIEDSDTSRRVFEVRAGAPANSLFVDSSGRVGIKTSTPVVNIHVAEGNTPALRLEQNGSSGFTAQTWDIAGNEANFFVRDVTNGSKLPFKIKPGAPDNALFVDGDGDIGMGTQSPGARLDVQLNDSGFPYGLRLLNQSTTGTFIGLRMETSSPTGADIDFNNIAGEWRINFDDGDSQELSLDAAGNLRITGTLTANGSNFPDYVFEPSYRLLRLEEVADHIRQYGHLPNVPSAEEVSERGLDMVKMQKLLFEKVEELTLYAIEQHTRVQALEERIRELQSSSAPPHRDR